MSSCCCKSLKEESPPAKANQTPSNPDLRASKDRKIVHHLVLLKFRNDVSPEDICSFYEGIRSLKKIKGVLHAEAGKQEIMYPAYADRAQGYNYAILVLLHKKEDLEAYDKDHHHVQVKERFIVPNLDKGADKPVMALDWEASPPVTIENTSSKYLSIGLCAAAAIGAVVVLRSML